MPGSLLRTPLLLAASALGAVPATAQTSPDLRIDLGDPPGATTSAAPFVVAQGDVVNVAFNDLRTGNSEVYFTRSLDRGRSWLASPIRVTNRPLTAYAGVGKIEMVARGDLRVLAWADGRDGLPLGHGSRGRDVYVARSTDGGLTWSPDQRINHNLPVGGMLLGNAPLLAASADGQHVYCAWDGNGIVIVVSHDFGATWQPFETVVSPPTHSASSANLAASGSSVYLAWYGRDSGTSGGYDIYCNASHDNGDTWKPAPVRVDTGDPPNAADSWSPQLAASGSWLYCAWYDERAPGSEVATDIYFNRSADGGDSWQPASTRIDTDPLANRSRVARIAAHGSQVYVTWVDHRNYVAANPDDIYVNASSDHGATWLVNDVQLNTDLVYSGDWPRVSCGDGYATVYWTGSWDILAASSIDGGQSWSSDVRLDVTDPGNTWSDAVHGFVDGEDFHAVWADRRDGLSDVYYATATSPVLRLVGTPAAGQSAHFALDGSADEGLTVAVVVSATGQVGGLPVPGTARAFDFLRDPIYGSWIAMGQHLTGPVANGHAETPPAIVPNSVPPGWTLHAGAVTLLGSGYGSVSRTIQFLTQ